MKFIGRQKELSYLNIKYKSDKKNLELYMVEEELVKQH